MPSITSIAAIAALLLAATSSAAGLYTKGSGVLNVDEKSWDKLIKNSDKSSIVEFYAPWCGHCQSLKPAYEKAAKSLEGLANVAAVNCDEESTKPFCGSMGIKGFPTLKTVRVTSKTGKPIISDYNGKRSATDIVEAVKGLIPNNVKRVEDKDLGDWLEKDSDKPKAILFSDKGTTSALIKALANDYLGNMPFAQIRNTQAEANKKYGVTKYPTLVVVPGGGKDAIIYDGELKKPLMNDFLGKYAELRKAEVEKDAPKKDKASKKDRAESSKASSKLAEASASQKSKESEEAAATASTIILEDPKPSSSPGPIVDEDAAKPATVPNNPPIGKLSTPETLQAACLGPKTQTCVLALLPASEESEAELPEDALAALSSLSALEQKHKKGGRSLFPFYSIDPSNTGGTTLKSALGLGADSLHLIAVSGKRNWWRQYDSAKGFGEVAVEGWIDGIRFGEGKKQKLPEGVVVEATEPASEDEKTAGETPGASDGDGKQKPIIHEDL